MKKKKSNIPLKRSKKLKPNKKVEAGLEDANIENDPELKKILSTGIIIEPPQPTPDGKKLKPKEKVHYVNGKEFEEKLPFEIDDDPAAIEYMTKQLQLAKMSQSKAQEAKALESEVVSFLQELKANPRKALANPMIGIDIKQLAAEILEEEFENSKKSPEQLEKEKLELELKAIKEEREREKKEAEDRAYQQTLERSYEKYENMLTSALESNPDLPSNPYIVDKMTKYMSIAVDAGYEPDMDIIVNIVRHSSAPEGLLPFDFSFQ